MAKYFLKTIPDLTRHEPLHKGPLLTQPAIDPLKCDPTLNPEGRPAPLNTSTSDHPSESI